MTSGRVRVKRLFLFAASLSLAVPVNAQESDAAKLVNMALDVCSNGDGPASAELLQEKLGSDLKNFAVFCLLYSQAWKVGFDAGMAREKSQSYDAFCRSAIEKVASGQNTYEADLNRNYPGAVERAVVASRCALYRTAYTAGMEKARAIVSR